jgi:hypothetical protein
LLDIWQLNNVEFKQGIVLREALRTMRNSPASYKQAVPFRETYGQSSFLTRPAIKQKICCDDWLIRSRESLKMRLSNLGPGDLTAMSDRVGLNLFERW